MFTQEEKNFIVNILAQTKVSPVQPDALQVVELVQSVVRKLTAEEIKQERVNMNEETQPVETPVEVVPETPAEI
jgi:hypothetical protein